MKFHNFDAGLLVALDALLSEKSVTRAGKRLHLSQPATSSILARLRQCFGNDLLVPTGRRMVLTPLAESLVQPVRDCLLQIQHTVASKMEFNPATSTRKFCLAVSEYTTAVLMSQALQKIAQISPGITFELVRLDETNEQKLEKGEIDFLIRPTAHALAMHPKESLFEDTLTCVVWSKNSLVGNTISPNKFFKMGHIAAHFGYSAILEDWFARHYGELLKVEVITQDFETACRLVVGTNRIAMVMGRMARLCEEYLPLRLIRPPFAIPPVIQCLQWHRYQDQDPGHIWLRTMLREAACKLSEARHPGTSYTI